jgi:type II secretory pathway pseudopilin PulG
VRHPGPVRSRWPGQGYSLIEVMFVLGTTAVLGGIAVPGLLNGLDELRTRAAARYISTRLQQIRMEAVMRSANVAFRVSAEDGEFAHSGYVDGHRDGVRTLDIQRGLDRPIHAVERLSHQFPGVNFGTLPDLPSIDAATPPPGADPIRLGTSDMVVFTPQGTATPGSLYIRGRGASQFAVRIFAETGKTRILRFDARSRTWKPL